MSSINTQQSRRDVLRKALTGGLSVGALTSLAGCNHEDTGDSPTDDSSRIRRSIASLQSSDPDNIIPTFRDAVRQLRNKSSSDPLNYNNIADIHGTPPWGFDCEHGNWQFLTWHRAYLFYFEDICRQITGNNDFALPYWNWADNPTVPSIFAQGAGSGSTNPLYESRRNLQPGDTLPTTLYNRSRVEQMLSDPNFFRFAGGYNFNCPRPQRPQCRQGSRRTGSSEGLGSGKNESPWHNDIHSRVGGLDSQGNPNPLGGAHAPRDPIFWTHHSMVDCLWYVWNIERGHSNTNDSDWYNSTALNNEFVDENGNQVGTLDVLATVLMPLSYGYELQPKGTTTATPGTTGRETVETHTAGTETDQELEARLREGANVELRMIDRFPLGEEVTVRSDEPITLETESPAEEFVPYLSGQTPSRPLLIAKGIATSQVNFFTRVYINRPEATVADSMDDPRFAGGFAFFNADGERGDGDLAVDVASPLRLLYNEDELNLDQPVSVRLVPARYGDQLEGDEAQWSMTNLDLAITQSRIDGEVVEY